MTRARLFLFLIPGAMSLSAVLLAAQRVDAVREAYATLATACMHLSAVLRGHAAALPITVAGTAVGALVIAIVSGAIALRRTRNAVKLLLRSRMNRVPERLGTLAASLGIAARLDLARSIEPLAFTHGVLRPRLLLSTALVDVLDDDELEAVLRHERSHMRGLDPLRILLVRALSVPLRLIPGAAGLADAYLCQRELDADRAAIHGMGDPFPLASALHRLLMDPGRPQLADLAVGALSPTDVRIDRLLGAGATSRSLLRPPSTLHVILFSLAAVTVLCLMLVAAHGASGVHPCVAC